MLFYQLHYNTPLPKNQEKMTKKMFFRKKLTRPSQKQAKSGGERPFQSPSPWSGHALPPKENRTTEPFRPMPPIGMSERQHPRGGFTPFLPIAQRMGENTRVL